MEGASAAVYLQQLINGLTVGSVYALIALGYTMVYGVLEMINFAHGDVFMVGSFMALLVLWLLGPPAAGLGMVLLMIGRPQGLLGKEWVGETMKQGWTERP